MTKALELYRSYWQRQETICATLGLPKPAYKVRRLRRVYHDEPEDWILQNIFNAMEWFPILEDN